MARTIRELAEEAIQIQDACSMLGLTKGMAKAVQELKDALEAQGRYSGTDQINTHTITQLWADKLYSLARTSEGSYSAAYADCWELAER